MANTFVEPNAYNLIIDINGGVEIVGNITQGAPGPRGKDYVITEKDYDAIETRVGQDVVKVQQDEPGDHKTRIWVREEVPKDPRPVIVTTVSEPEEKSFSIIDTPTLLKNLGGWIELDDIPIEGVLSNRLTVNSKLEISLGGAEYTLDFNGEDMYGDIDLGIDPMTVTFWDNYDGTYSFGIDLEADEDLECQYMRLVYSDVLDIDDDVKEQLVNYKDAYGNNWSSRHSFFMQGTYYPIGCTVEGDFNTVKSSTCAHMEGIGNTCENSRAQHVEGAANIASAYAAHAEGQFTVSNGNCTHTEGVRTTAAGYASHAGGYCTIANGPAQTAIGIANVADSTSLLIVGNGTASNTGAKTRSNAFTVSKTGAGKFASTVECTGIYLTSPNKTRYLLTVSDTGELITTKA